MNHLTIKNGRLIDPANGIDEVLSLHIASGKIASVGAKPDGFVPDKEIDAQGLIVTPGFIDLCARLREPGLEYKATIESETRAAAASGFTTLCCPPDTHPVIDTPAVVKLVQQKAHARVLAIGALTRGLNGKDLSEMSALKQAGCIAVSNAQAPLANALILRRALEYASNLGLTVFIRPEDDSLRNGGCVHEGEVGSRLGLPGIPVSAETVAIAEALSLVKQTGARVHFAQLSSAAAIDMIRYARQKGMPVSCDVSIHQLHLTEAAIEGFNANAHVIPPFRTLEDRQGLREGLKEGVIQAICSDHQPHDPDAKLDAFSSTEPGISSLETVLPLTLQLVEQGALNLNDAIARLTSGPAAVLGLPSGTLSVGAVADICLFDSGYSWRVDASNWLSRGLNTPYWHQALKGRVVHVLLEGMSAFQR